MGILTPASGYDWNRDYGVNATLERNDNFRLTENNPVATTSARLGVFADLNGTTELSNLRFRVGARATNYSETSIEDTDEYYLSLASARRGERWSGNLDMSYISRSTTETESLDTGRLVDGNRNTANIAPGFSYQLDERNSVYTNFGFTDVTYDTVSFTDYTDTSIKVGWVNQLSETSEASLNGNVSEFNPDNDDTTFVTGLNIGYGFNTSEATRYNLQLGYQERDTPIDTERNGNSSFEVRHSIDERNDFSLFAGRGYVPSGSGGVRYESRLDMRWNHALSERMQFTLSAEGVDRDERDYIGIVVGGRHQYTREISFAANYRYRNQQSSIYDDADSNSVSISLSYSPI